MEQSIINSRITMKLWRVLLFYRLAAGIIRWGYADINPMFVCFYKANGVYDAGRPVDRRVKNANTSGIGTSLSADRLMFVLNSSSVVSGQYVSSKRAVSGQ